MFNSFNNPRQRSPSHSFSHPVPLRPQDYYLPNSASDSPALDPSGTSSRHLAREHSRHDYYSQHSDQVYRSVRHNAATNYDARHSFSQSSAFSQSYNRHVGTSDLHISSSISYHAQHSHNALPPVYTNMDHLKRNEPSTVVDNYSLAPHPSEFASESPLSAIPGPPSEHSDSDFWSTETPDAPAAEPSKPRKARREKPRIALAPDQPPTTQGKPRARVYVACVQCRTRKIRCDGAKPVCHNCGRRSNGNNECDYDPVPKRRGPDKIPGARQRMARDLMNEIDNGLPQRRRRRTSDNSSSHSNETTHHQMPMQHPSTSATDSPQNRRPGSDSSIPLTLHSSGDNSSTSEFVPLPNYSRSSYTPCGCHGLSQCPELLGVWEV
ncbi:unnamed protein product [Cyclocybe aegerita]|uniref:Zn(2)-C6 fungal-type domain-containing protein n=1 Tax=Cyclocybe aegerita TaxID=1973307 RepID=A0A8S0W3X2_CYCAE|nr:unnamed protein product [Cyclocybe aegerita]